MPGLIPSIRIVQVARREYCAVKDGGYGQSIGSTVSDAIVSSWLCSTATSSELSMMLLQ